MKWISALDLQQWADRIGARTIFPALIRDLITASANDISDVRFPSGDKGQVRGFDGWLDAAGAPPYVPAGRSIWEFGIGNDAADKFAKDYVKRVDQIDETERKETTFVFATSRTWDNPGVKLPDFVKAYADKSDFRDVRYIDGSMLEDWLQRCGAVGARYAREVLGRVPQNGARSTDEFWDEFTRRFRPAVNEDVVLAARSEQAEQIITHMLSKSGALVFVGDGPDEVNAVVIAAIRKAPAESRAFLEARTLVVDTDVAGRALAVADRYGYLVSPSANNISGFLSGYGPTISALGFNPPGKKYPRLARPSTHDMTIALQTIGLSEDEASALAVKSGRVLSILERHAPAASYIPPDWVSEGAALIPALLAGSWDARHEGDQAILAELGGADYHQIESRLRGFLTLQDSPLDREAGIWKLRAPVDAFVHLAGQLGAEHLALFGPIAMRLFTTPPPNIAEERFGVSTALYSSQLREGVAGTLLMLAALHEELGLELGQDPVRFVNELIERLPGLNEDPRVILSLERQLPALMEASPDPLLSALERLLEGNGEKILPIFEETVNFGAARNELANLLWALEVKAWDPSYLPRVARILAQMVAIDPGGRSGNRPIGTLRDIFVAWNPGTNAPLVTRIAVLDMIATDVPETAWPLLSQLLPKWHDSKVPTQRPRFRESGASHREILTHGLVAETYDAVTDRVLGMLGSNVDRWKIALDAFPRFSPDRRWQFIDLLSEYAATVTDEDRVALRRAILRLADRHRRFNEAEWALPEAEVEQLEALGSALESSDPVDKARLLFDEWIPGFPTDYAEAEKQISVRRSVAVGRLVVERGISAVLDLARKARIPALVASAAAAGIDDEGVLIDLIDQAGNDPTLEEFAISLAGALRWSRGEAFDERILTIARDRGWSHVRTATMLLGWPEVPSTWDLVAGLGSDAQDAFWSKRGPRRFEGSAEDLAKLVTNYLSVKRPGTALEAIHGREDDLVIPLVAELLGMRVQEINEGGIAGDMDGYYIEELFKKLRKRADVSPDQIAAWEYAFFPMLEYQDQDLVIYDLMANDPSFFVSILKDVFVEDGTNPDEQETTEEQRQRGNASHRILIAFDRAPAQQEDLSVDPDRLEKWVSGMIEAATEAKRLSIVNSYIGRALAHTAELDGVWPQRPVADVIERLHSEDLERGIQIERYNMRGVFSRAMFEGGVQERELAERYRGWAAQQPASHMRTRAMLNSIAEGWDTDAKHADDEAARDRLRFQ